MKNMHYSNDHYDIIGIGIGPFNLSLACLAEPIANLKTLFFDKNSNFDWHPGLMLEEAHLQTPFISDLVTLADPTSRFSFLNYLKKNNKIYPFYIRENFFILRKEYNQYCQWVCQNLSNLVFNHEVNEVTYDSGTALYTVTTYNTLTQNTQSYKCKNLVLGVGTTPYIPACAQQITSPKIIHSSEYLHHRQAILDHASVAVIGSGQSAAEIFYDLLNTLNTETQALHWLTRSERFSPLEYTKLTLEMTSPDYLNHFYSLPESVRKQLNKDSQTLYKGINSSLINDIHERLYMKQLDGKQRVHMLTNSELCQVDTQLAYKSKNFILTFKHQQTSELFKIETDYIILSTGYKRTVPNYLNAIDKYIRWTKDKQFHAHQHFAIDHQGTNLFVQNAEFNTHGFITPDLGMVCYRNSVILKHILGYEPYPIETHIAFQTFGSAEAR